MNFPSPLGIRICRIREALERIYVNQTERAAAFSAYAKKMLADQHYVVGYHWWQWADEPATGRWPDGEDSNCKLINNICYLHNFLTCSFSLRLFILMMMTMTF